jgi:hypothetical protein
MREDPAIVIGLTDEPREEVLDQVRVVRGARNVTLGSLGAKANVQLRFIAWLSRNNKLNSLTLDLGGGRVLKDISGSVGELSTNSGAEEA